MIFRETRLKGVFEIELDAQDDERGLFARSYCWREFEAHGLNPRVVQCNVSHNRRRGTLRGMHYQEAPDAGGQADSLRSRRPVRRRRRPPARFADLPAMDGGGIESRARPAVADAVCAGRIRPRLPDARGRHRDLLSDVRVLCAARRRGDSAGTTRRLPWTWPEPVRVISERDRTYPDFAVDRPQVAAS